MWCQDIGIGKIINRIPDELYLKIVCFLQYGTWIDIKHPSTYNEKLQWLKIHGEYEQYANVVDKAEAKIAAANVIGKEYIIPTYAVVDRFEQLNFETLPRQFVLKCTHDSGSTIVCLDKCKFDFNAAQKRMKHALTINYSGYLREKQYKNIKPRIIVEKYLGVDEKRPFEYKFFCFNGIPKIVMVAKDRESTVKTNFYDMDFNLLPLKIENPNFPGSIKSPPEFNDMKRIAEKLSQGYKHVRVDLYDINGHVYFSELTFQHWGGVSYINPPEWDKIMGDWIQI